MDIAEEAVEMIEVRFRTELDKYRITEKAFSIPVTLNKGSLSETINHLLETQKPVSFDFLVDGEFIRGSVGSFLKKKGKTAEEIVTVDYVLAVAPPEPKGTSTQPDWISTFDNHMRAFVKHARATKGLGKAMLIPFGSYDKVLHNMYRGIEGQEDINAVGHEQPITGLSSYVETEGTITMASSSQDETVRVWSLNLQTNKAKCNFLGVGHEGAVESVEISPDGRVLASSGWDSTIKLWALKEDDDDEEMPDPAKGRDSKRAKHKEKESGPKELKCRSTLTGHTQSASVVRWISQEQLVTGSWDHSVRFWDVASGVNTNTLSGTKVVLSLDYTPLNHLVATGNSDRSVRVWDSRSATGGATIGENESNSISSQYTSHTGWVSAVRWHPTNSQLLLSASYDNSLKLWDIRSKSPLHTLPNQHSDKIMCLEWVDDYTFVSGGADSTLKFYTFSGATVSRK